MRRVLMGILDLDDPTQTLQNAQVRVFNKDERARVSRLSKLAGD